MPWVALDTDSIAVTAARKRGLPVWFGDARHQMMLEHLGIARARLLLVTLNNAAIAEQVVQSARRNCALMPLVVRTHDRSHARRLRKVAEVQAVPENLELALQMAAYALRGLAVEEDAIQHRLALARDSALES